MTPPASKTGVARTLRDNLIVALSLGCLALSGIAPASAQQCVSTELSSPIGSLLWPVPLDQGQAILGIDATSGGAVRIQVDPTRSGLGHEATLRAGAVQRVPADPMMFSQVGNDVVQLSGDFTFGPIVVNRYDQNLRRRDSVELPTTPGETRLVAPYSWVALEGHIVGFGAVGPDKDNLQFGMFDQTLPLRGSQEAPAVSLIHPFGDLSFYLAGNPLFTAVGDQVFYLEMGRFPALYRYDLGMGTPPELILGLPGEDRFTQNGDIQNMRSQGHDEFQAFMRSYQGPWSLYEHQGQLLVLTKERRGSSPSWTFHRLEVEGDFAEVVATHRIASEADNLVVLPKAHSDQYLLFEVYNRDGADSITHMKVCRF